MGWFDERRQRKAAEQALRAELETVFRTKNEYGLVIFKAYERMAMNLERYCCARRDAETIRQYFQRLASSVPLDVNALVDFQAQFEQARYSQMPMGEADRGRAINALRAVQYSLEKLGPPPRQTAKNAGAALPAGSQPPLQQHPKYWVVPPPLMPVQGSPAGPGPVHAPVGPADVAAFYRMIGPKNATAEQMPAEAIAEMKDLVAQWKWARLAELVESALAGPAGKCRLHLDITSARYMLEFGRALKETGKVGADPQWDAHLKWLAAAQVLSLAEGRDYLLPDDLKVAMLLGPVAKAFHITAAEAIPALERVPVLLVDARFAFWPVDVPVPPS